MRTVARGGQPGASPESGAYRCWVAFPGVEDELEQKWGHILGELAADLAAYGYAIVRLDDPSRPETVNGARATSRQAALAALPASGTVRRRVLDALAEVWPAGLTDEAGQHATGVDGDTWRPRRRELELGGHIADSGDRGVTDDGNEAIVWKLTLAGRARLGMVRIVPRRKPST